jgi:hypothetical protein
MRIRIGHHCHGRISSSPVSWYSVQNCITSIVVGFVGVTWLCWVVAGMGVIVSSVASSSNSNCNSHSHSNSRMRRSSGDTTLAFVGHRPSRLAPLAATSRTRRRNNDHHPDDDDDSDSDGDDSRYPTESAFRIPQLPPVGGATSSLLPQSLDEEQEEMMVGATTTTRPMVGRAKIQLQYTCTICDTRNVHTMSRLAYRHGVVIARCQQCRNQHWIADHLGWLSLESSSTTTTTTTASRAIHTIEDYFTQHSDKNVTVHRVTPDVFALEQMLHASPSGTSTRAMVGDNSDNDDSDNDDHGPKE